MYAFLIGLTVTGHIYGYLNGNVELYGFMGLGVGGGVLVAKCIFCD